MVSQVKRSEKTILSIAVVLVLAMVSFTAHGQLFKKKKTTEADDNRSTYAYQTFSTTQRKENKKGYSSDEAKFHFEKPLTPVPYGENNRDVDYSKAPYFGHKRPPIRRPPGKMKLCKVCGIKH
jgi:hypothetical protein